MSKIDYQKLREIAEKTKIAGKAPVMPFDQRINALNDFMKHFSPDIALALLDERERNLQYIKRRDQESEEIALTVGKLRVELEAAKKRIAELEAEPVSQAYNLAELIEGMEVSIDVSTCDADLGNRYFGTVTEALELDTAKNGYILLVQDAEPNFDVNGNSPVTPDGWIPVSERMPEPYEYVLVTDGFDGCEVMRVNTDGYWGPAKSLYPGGITHWMPLPEPPQEVNRG
ncbi:ead/Ea22-like family protein [Escherichia coli]|uniref:ead/Ea22-like family protein n=1 Tax=Escherichia coli TaxID=562 RepID=UPI00211F1EAF|nr:ead/Ea22-like family protein [Escherichia coli]UUQ34002.1 ead/Ea22-like family protein [Escherichia coli]